MGEKFLLDVACGTGTGLGELRRLSQSALVVGADVSARMLRPAAGSFPVVQADAAALPFAADSADAIVCCFALMHLPAPRLAVAEFARVLRPGGGVALTTWGADRPWPARAAVLKILDSLGVPAVASSHHGGAATNSPDKLAALLADAGFQQVEAMAEPLGVRESCDVEATLRAWSSLGSTATRLAHLDAATREEFFRRARRALAEFGPGDLADPHEVAYAWARAGA